MTHLRKIGTKIGELFSKSLPREEGQTLAEYALILALIAAVVAVVVVTLGGTISSLFNSISSQI